MKPRSSLRKLLTATLLLAAATLNAQTNMDINTLDQRRQDLAAVAALEAKGDTAALRNALNRALDDGLTVNQLKEALSHLYAYTGFPRSLNGQGVLRNVLADRRARGISDNEGPAASPLPKDYDALRDGTAVQTRLTGGQGYNYTFDPANDYYLKAHLFGDIFARDVLSPAEREVVTVSALSAIDGLSSQLKSHVAGARNMGVGDEALHALPAVLKERVGEVEAYRAARAVADVFSETCSEPLPLGPTAFPKGDFNAAYAQYFTGNSYLAPLLKEGMPISNVTFEPRCRNNWHIHHKAQQILICVSGEGWYAEWGKPARRLRPGDVICIPAEVKHWHGAAKDRWFQHLAFAVAEEGASNEWLEPVTDEEYDKLP